MYEFSTSQALGLSAMAVAANPDTRELLGVFAIDYDVGAISSVISSTLSGAGSWTFAVERSNGKCVGISTGEQLYNRSALTKHGGTLNFFQSRLSAVDSSHPSIAAAATMLAARGWPGNVTEGFHHREGEGNGFEFETRLLTGDFGLDWLVVAGMTFACESTEVWASLNGQCETCDAGKAPAGRVCQQCQEGSAGAGGTCQLCADGKQPNPARTACVACPDGFSGTRGQCNACDRSQEPTPGRDRCICPEGTYDSWRPLASARNAIWNETNTTITPNFPRPENPLHVFVWAGGRRWNDGSLLEPDDFNRKWDPSGDNPRCVPCPVSGVGCSNGVARPWAGFREIPAASDSGFDLHFYACPIDELEEADSTVFRCIGVQDDSQAMEPPDGLRGTVGDCVANHTGMLCASCAEGYGKDLMESECRACETLTAGNILATVGIFVGFLLVCLLVHHFWKQSALHHLARVAFQPGRILVSYAQVTSQLGAVLNVVT